MFAEKVSSFFARDTSLAFYNSDACQFQEESSASSSSPAETISTPVCTAYKAPLQVSSLNDGSEAGDETEDSPVEEFLDDEEDDDDETSDFKLEEKDIAAVETSVLHGEDIDKALAAKLNCLSLGEREALLHDIHGIGEKQDFEEPNFRELRLQEFEYWVSKKSSGFPAYNLAVLQSPNYVQDQRFRLKFLRSADWDAKAAAILMLKHFEVKLRLFGASKLGQDIQLKDLDDDDMECLRSGAIQRLGRDHAGRIVTIYLTSNYSNYKKFDNQLRSIFYFVMKVVDDEITQKKGSVIINYGILPDHQPADSFRRTTLKERLHFLQTLQALPKVTAALHFCASSKLHYGYMGLTLARFVSNNMFLRSRVHYGSRLECYESLKTFGIPVSNFPVNAEDGSLDRTSHLKWLEVQSTIESGETPLLVPCTTDVLLGRGRPYQEHWGNTRLHLMIESNLLRYEGSSKKEKTAIAFTLVNDIKSNGGRFLVKAGKGADSWQEVPDEVARKKISHDFRTIRSAYVKMARPTAH